MVLSSRENTAHGEVVATPRAPANVEVAVVEAPPTNIGPEAARTPPLSVVGVEVPIATTPVFDIEKRVEVA